jgi:peptide chain release factor subunit 1
MAAYSPLLALFALAPNLRRASNRALSIYIPARLEGYDSRFYDIEFGDLIHRYKDRMTEKDKALMDYELRRLRAHLAVVRPAACPAIAGFADEAAGIVEIIKLPRPTDKRLEVGQVLIAPILRQLEETPPALVAVVDKEHARTFGAILDHIFTLHELDGVQVKRIRSGATSASSNQRKADNRAKQNLESAAKIVEREMASGAYMNLYIAGPEEAHAEFERLLPEPMKKKIAGRIGVVMDSPTLKHDLRERLAAAMAAPK